MLLHHVKRPKCDESKYILRSSRIKCTKLLTTWFISSCFRTSVFLWCMDCICSGLMKVSGCQNHCHHFFAENLDVKTERKTSIWYEFQASCQVKKKVKAITCHYISTLGCVVVSLLQQLLLLKTWILDTRYSMEEIPFLLVIPRISFHFPFHLATGANLIQAPKPTKRWENPFAGSSRFT